MALTKKDLVAEFRIAEDWRDDPWGTSMSVWFQVAAELYARGTKIPFHWNYTAGASNDPREPESYWFDVLQDCESDTLREFGNMLFVYSRKLSALGYDY